MKKSICNALVIICSLAILSYVFLMDRYALYEGEDGYSIAVEKAILSLDGYERAILKENGFLMIFIDSIYVNVSGSKGRISNITIRGNPYYMEPFNKQYSTPIDCDEHISFESQCRDMTQLYHSVYEEMQELYSKKVQQFEEKA